MLEWKLDSDGSTALLIEGARRVGKSTLARQFGINEYSSCVFIDFVDAPSGIRELFDDLADDLDSFFSIFRPSPQRPSTSATPS